MVIETGRRIETLRVMKYRAVILVGLIFLLCGCSEQNKDTKTEQSSAVVSNQAIDISRLGSTSDATSQTFFEYQDVASIGDDYYVWQPTEGYFRLMCYDSDNDQYTPVCNKPNCMHDSLKCNAILSDPNIEFSGNYISSYGNELFTLGYDEAGNVSVYQIEPDGSGFSEYLNLYQADLTDPTGLAETSWTEPSVLFHGGYIYYIVPDQETSAVRRMNLSDQKEEIVYMNEKNDPMTYRMKAYGDYIFFQAGGFTDASHMNVDGGIYAYSIPSGEVMLVKAGVVAGYAITNGSLVYATQDSIHVVNLSSSDDQLIAKTERRVDLAAVDSKIYAFDDERLTLTVYDLSGQEIVSIDSKGIYQFMMGDDKTLFARGENEAGKTKEFYLRITDENPSWIPLGE